MITGNTWINVWMNIYSMIKSTHITDILLSRGVLLQFVSTGGCHDDVITWKHFPRYWPFVWRIHRSPVNSPHKGQWPGALMFSLICVWINDWVNNGEAGDLRRYRIHYDVTVMVLIFRSRCMGTFWDAVDRRADSVIVDRVLWPIN